MPSVSSTPVDLGSGSVLIQNLGPGDLFLGDPGVTTETGFRISAGSSVTVGYSNSRFYVVSDSTSDARVLSAGSGFFGGPDASGEVPPAG